jgi:hypothetical protein
VAASIASLLAVMSGPGLAFAQPAVNAPICQQTVPAATDGHLTVDRSSVRPGESTLGVLTDFTQWPAGLIGGGSGETFLSCAPWLPLGHAEVMTHDVAAMFLITVPTGTPPGTYRVGVVFYQGSRQPFDSGPAARLDASLTVSARPSPPGPSPACQLSHAPAAGGSLEAPAMAQSGTGIQVAVTGVKPTRLSWLNEYAHLQFVACLGGRATAVTTLASGTSPFTVAVPAGLRPGPYRLTVTGTLDATVSEWGHAIQVSSPPPPSAPPTVAPTPPGSSVMPVPEPQPTTADTGYDPWAATALGLGLSAAGAALLLAARRRRASLASARRG